MTRVLACGGRTYTDSWRIDDELDTLASTAQLAPISHVIVGDALGADMLIAWWARRRGKPVTVYEADWKKHGKAAGPKRNATMLREGKPDVVLAFPGGKGTANMITQARKAGVHVIEVMS
jgi:orotate phosphoribosyltransferase